MSSLRTGLPALTIAALASCLLQACASVPAQVQDAQHLSVSYWDFRADTLMRLVSEDDPKYEGLYSRPLDNANTKLAAAEELKELVEYAGSRDFFASAGSLAEPTAALRSYARGMIAITADGTSYSIALEQSAIQNDPDLLEMFSDVRARIRLVYDSIQQLQFIKTNSGDIFEKQQERLRQENLDRMNRKGGDR
ncbi:MAG: hypothetical protein V2A76_18750 [Planctomycetota bacterium]